MIANLDPTRANAPLEEIVRDYYVNVARNGILPPATGQGSNASDNMRRMEWEFLRNDLLAVKPKIRHSNFLADVNTFALGMMDVVFEKHPYFDVVPESEYDLQKDVRKVVLSAFERKAGEWCDVVTVWQTFVQQVRSSTVEAIARKHSKTIISSLPSMIRAEALTVHAKLAQVEQYGVFASRTTHQPGMPKGQPQQGGHSKPPAVGGKSMVQQQRGAPSKPGAGEAATDMNKSGVFVGMQGVWTKEPRQRHVQSCTTLRF
jgi:hypothetical protein